MLVSYAYPCLSVVVHLRYLHTQIPIGSMMWIAGALHHFYASIRHFLGNILFENESLMIMRGTVRLVHTEEVVGNTLGITLAGQEIPTNCNLAIQRRKEGGGRRWS